MLAADLSPATLRSLINSHPYERFIVLDGEKLAGIVTRHEIQAALSENRLPKLEKAVTCQREQTIRELESLLIASSTQLVVVLSAPLGRVLGLITLHDVLRAQAAKAQSGGGE